MTNVTNVFKFLTPSRSINGEHTHVSMGDVKGSWYLSSDKSSEFYRAYANALEKGEKISIAEKPGEFVPLLVDIDIKKEVDGKPNYGPDDFYNHNDIITVIKVFQKAISENLDRRPGAKKLTNRNLRCIFLEKDLYIEEKDNNKFIVKKGIHLHFPHLFLSKKDIKSSLMPKVKTMLDDAGPFKDFINSEETKMLSSSLIDDVSSKCWLMYGSSKEGNNMPYKISKIFDHNQNVISASKCFQTERCLDGTPITDANVEKELPRLLSINPKPDVISGKLFEVQEIQATLSDLLVPLRQDKRNLNEDGIKLSDREIKKMKKITSFLSSSRSDDYNQWWTVGITLFNIGISGKCEDEALEAWKEFSCKSSKYDESQCDLTWFEMAKKNKPINARTMGSLIFMAKTDNRIATEKYLLREQMNLEEEEQRDIESVKKLRIPVFDTEIAETFVSQHEDEYLNGNMGWFKFNGTIWAGLEAIGRHIRPSLVSLSRAYINLIPALTSLIKVETEDDEGYEADNRSACSTEWSTEGEDLGKITKIVNNKIKSINDLARKCQNNGPQMGIIKVIEDMIGIDNLSAKMDQANNLIAFTNGVYDLSMFNFRQGLPEDYITKQMNICYDITLTLESPKVIKMLNFFKKIFPDEELFEYFMLENCEMYFGGNRDKVLQIWTGEGDNGKSVTNKIIEDKFGKLAVKFPKGMVTGDTPKAGACFPELTRAQGGVRWAVIDEFAPDETINAGIIKNLTGGIDKLYARDIHQKGKDVIDIDPFFKLIFICNTIPNIRNPDTATWNRIRVIPFESTFKDNIDDFSTEEQIKEKIFLKDTSFCEKDVIKELGEALSWYLLEIFVKKEKERIKARQDGKSFNIKIPLKVSEATELYKAQGNAIIDYFNDKFEKSDNDNDVINVKLYYQDFILWFSQTHANKNVNMDKKKFLNLFTQHAKGDINTYLCKNIRPKTSIDDDIEYAEDGMPLM
jgi:phage/plasmid-associated DNA primase